MDITDFDWFQAALAQAREHEMTLDEVCRCASKARSARHFDELVDEYVDHIPVVHGFYDMERDPDFIGPISWTLSLERISNIGFTAY